MTHDGSAEPPSRWLAKRLRAVRSAKAWSQAELAKEVTALGRPIDQSAIARVERGTRGVSLDEAFTLAAALGVSPLALVLPPDGNEPVAVAPHLTAVADDVRPWVRGEAPLPGQDTRFFETHSPAFWVDIETWRRTGRMRALVEDLAEGSERGDARSMRSTLRALAEEVERLQGEVGARRGTKGEHRGKR